MGKCFKTIRSSRTTMYLRFVTGFDRLIWYLQDRKNEWLCVFKKCGKFLFVLWKIKKKKKRTKVKTKPNKTNPYQKKLKNQDWVQLSWWYNADETTLKSSSPFLSLPLRILFILFVPNFSSLWAFLNHFCGVWYEVWEFMKHLFYTTLQEEPRFIYNPLHGVVGCHMLIGEMSKR